MTSICVAAVAALIASCLSVASSATAADGPMLVTQAKALAGNVTPGDAAGFPVTISTPGSYVLAGNLQVPANVSGFVVTATEVSIDLNGFRINGNRGTGGIGIDGHQRNLTVRNGTIRNFTLDGVRSLGAMLIVEDMRIEENGRMGVYDQANGFARIVSSTIFGNSASGIQCGDSCHVEGNIVSSNGFRGVYLTGLGATVLGNTIFNNLHYGVYALDRPGFGNNTIISNGEFPHGGFFNQLLPNACWPDPC